MNQRCRTAPASQANRDSDGQAAGSVTGLPARGRMDYEHPGTGAGPETTVSEFTGGGLAAVARPRDNRPPRGAERLTARQAP